MNCWTLICLLNWFKGGLRLFSDIWIENAALLKRFVEIHSNPPNYTMALIEIWVIAKSNCLQWIKWIFNVHLILIRFMWKVTNSRREVWAFFSHFFFFFTPEYLAAISEILLFLMIPDNEFNSKPFSFLIREVIANGMIKPMIEQLTDPDYVNQTIIWIVSNCQSPFQKCKTYLLGSWLQQEDIEIKSSKL